MASKTVNTSETKTAGTGKRKAADDEKALLQELKDGRKKVVEELRKRITGQDEVIEQVLIALYAGGHVLITGVPGLAKTLLIKSLGEILQLSYKRIQFTPDLMPADITGSEILEEDHATGKRKIKFVKGPIFANIILADEINRTPPKTQSALLEAMQEYQVTAGGCTMKLKPPFFVLATQNPIELEGTYPLPEAQLDRFMFNVVIDYLSEENEFLVAMQTTSNVQSELRKMLTGKDILNFQKIIRKVFVPENVGRFAVNLVRSTRPDDPASPDFIKKWTRWGAGLRACQFLLLGGKVRAVFHDRVNVSVQDIKAMAHPVLRHRIITNFYAESEKMDSEKIITMLLDHVKEPMSGL